MLKYVLLSLLAMICAVGLLVNTATADPADNNFTSNEMTGNGQQTTVTVTVDTTTATDWSLQKYNTTTSQWETVQTGTTSSQTFTIACDNNLQNGVQYRVKGHTSAQSGPYKATATAS